jgi:hypothetical protein
MTDVGCQVMAKAEIAFGKDFLLKSCLNLQVMYQDYVHDKIWIFRFYMICST